MAPPSCSASPPRADRSRARFRIVSAAGDRYSPGVLFLWTLLGGFAVFVIALFTFAIRSQLRRTRLRTDLARALGFFYQPPTGIGLLFAQSQAVFELEGEISGYATRVNVRNARTEIQLGLKVALPGALRIVPAKGRLGPGVHEIRDVDLVPGMAILAQDPEPAKAYLQHREVRRMIERFFRSHPGARLLGGELSLPGPAVDEPHAIRRAVEHAIELAEVLARPAPDTDSIVVSGGAESEGVRLGVEATAAIATGLSGTSGVRAVAPESLGPVSKDELRLREAYGRTVTRAFVCGGIPAAVGGLMMLLNQHSHAPDSFSHGMIGFGLLGVGAAVYQLMMRCPGCKSMVSVWRYAIPSECTRCGLRLR